MRTSEMAMESRRLRVELEALEPQAGGAPGEAGALRWVCDLEARSRAAKLRIGVRPDADIVLPARRYPTIAYLHCAIVATPEAVHLESYHPETVRLDGKPAEDAVVEPGAHELVIDRFRFRLTLALV